MSSAKTKRTSKKSNKLSYVNVNRAKKGYKDKYKKDVEKALRKYSQKIGKTLDDSGNGLSNEEWRNFFKTVLIPLDKESERKMIDLFSNDRKELNELLVLHNTLAAINLAEVYYKKYEKECPTKWYDLEDFKQQALLGLAEGAKRFDLNRGDKFITYATWWMLNKVRKPRQEKGSDAFHISINRKNDSSDPDCDTTFEDILTPSMISKDWKSSSTDPERFDPANHMEQQRIYESEDLFNNIRSLDIESIDKSKALELNRYLISILEKNSNSYQDHQIFLYMFKKVFKRSSNVFEPNSSEHSKLSAFVSSAAKSKAELLRRLDLNETQYEAICKNIVKRNWGDGIKF